MKRKGNICEIDYFKKLVKKFEDELLSIAGAPEEEVLKIGNSDTKEYLRILKELSSTVVVSFRKISRIFAVNDILDDKLMNANIETNQFDKNMYQNQIDTLKKNLERKNAGRKRTIEKKGVQISNDDVIEKRKKGMIIKDISKETGLSIATINRIIKKQK